MLICNINTFTESDDGFEFDSPKALSMWMKANIEYDPNESSWKLRDHDTVMKEKKGNCHDQAEFELVELKKMGYRPKRLFMIEYSGDEIYDAGATHTICYYEDNGNLYWFENSWDIQAGINGPYKNMKELKDAIYEAWEFGRTFDKLYITTCGHIHKGMNLNKYVVACLKGNYYPKDYYSKKTSLKESTEAIDSFKSPEDLSKWMKSNITYQPYRDTWRLKSKEQLLESGKGNCFDQTEFEVEILKKLGYKPKKMFICEYMDDKPLEDINVGGSHVFVYYEDNGKLYWFENSWGQYKGIHGPYSSIAKIREDIREKWNWNPEYKYLYFCSYGSLKPGSDLHQVYNAILGDKRLKVKAHFQRD